MCCCLLAVPFSLAPDLPVDEDLHNEGARMVWAPFGNEPVDRCNAEPALCELLQLGARVGRPSVCCDGGKPILKEREHGGAHCLQPAIQVKRGDEGLQGGGEVAWLLPAAACLLAPAHDEGLPQAQLHGHRRQGLGANDLRPPARELALLRIRKAAKKLLCKDQIQHGIAQKLKPLVVGHLGRVLVHVGRVHERFLEQLLSAEAIPKEALQAGHLHLLHLCFPPRLCAVIMGCTKGEGEGLHTVILEDIVAGLRAIGLPLGATVLVHSSLSSFGHVEGGPEAVVDALLQAVGPGGTVLVPTLTGSAALGPQNPPVFDVRHTPCWTGLIPETFRRRPEALRSLHPTHSVAAIGPRSQELLQGHDLCDTPCAADSPYGRLVKLEEAYIAFLGVNLGCNTTFHHLEEEARVPYHLQPEPVLATIIDYDGQRHERRLWLHQYGVPRNFARPEPYFIARKIERMGRIGNCTVKLLQARPMADYVRARLRADPFYLVGGQPSP